MSRYSWFNDVIVEDDPNKQVRGYTILIRNQGSTMVKVGEDILLPDDQFEVSPPANDENGYVDKVIRIKFLGPIPLTNPLAMYPQLSFGNRLVITELKKVGQDG